MKKIFSYLILLALPLLVFSCRSKAPETPVSKMKSVLYTSIPASSEVIELLAGKSKTVDVNVCAEAVSDVYMTMTFKVDPEAVASYNSKNGTNYEILPSSAFTFTKGEVMLPRFNTASSTAKLRIAAVGLEDNKMYLLPVTLDKVTGTDNWQLSNEPVAYLRVIQVNTGPEGGDGSAEYPYILGTVDDLLKMGDRLSSEEKVYFRMTNDIDMSGVNWIPLNAGSPYDKEIDFDGAGHTISNFHCEYTSYPSFFGVLNGYCHDVTFKDASIDCSADSGCGILGGYAGTGAIHAEVMRVHVQGRVTMTGNKTGVGGMFGTVANANICASSADCVVYSGKNYVGGLFGYSKNTSTGTGNHIKDCWVGGAVRGDQRVGGITGGINGDNDSVENCYCIAEMFVVNAEGNKEYAATRSVGGIVGHCNQDKADACDTRMPGDVISGCIAWQDEIKTRTDLGDGTPASTGSDFYSAGAIVAFGSTHNTYANCFRKASLDFRDYCSAFLLYDQENTSPTSPLMIKKVDGSNYNFPYHGKAAPAGKTLSQLAQDLGWSPEIWDFSGELPTIRPDASYNPVEDTHGDGQIGDFDDNKLN